MNRIYGQDSNWQEKPVSIREARERNRLERAQESTREVLKKRAERARTGATENAETPWEVQAMDYFNGRFDAMEKLMLNVRENMGVLLINFDDVLGRLEALEKKFDERSESGVAVEPKVVVTLDVPADVAEELQAELEKRVERIMARRAQHSQSC